MKGLVLVNPAAGADDGRDVADAFAEHEVQICPPDQLTALVDQACRRTDLDFVGVAGGDGTIRTVAQQLRDTDIPLLAIPGGTRNHFARDLGIDSIETARRAAAEGTIERIDVGEVNGHTFLNNLSIGVYPKLVRRREAHQERLPKRVANLVAAFDQLVNGRRTEITVDGEPHQAWAVFVGNGHYGSTMTDLISRETLDDGRLDLRVVRADQRLARLRVTVAMILGRLDRSPLVHESSTAELRLVPRARVIEAALDGEVIELVSPLDVRCVREALRVVVPPASSDEAGS